mmetsp:Transcript_21747/g.53236  ORF Transcript_21747/g.53236 Transcript_21747/m.53236 type:complete len:206 (-) Transcript_21747:929-1546(-)
MLIIGILPQTTRSARHGLSCYCFIEVKTMLSPLAHVNIVILQWLIEHQIDHGISAMASSPLPSHKTTTFPIVPPDLNSRIASSALPNSKVLPTWGGDKFMLRKESRTGWSFSARSNIQIKLKPMIPLFSEGRERGSIFVLRKYLHTSLGHSMVSFFGVKSADPNVISLPPRARLSYTGLKNLPPTASIAISKPSVMPQALRESCN